MPAQFAIILNGRGLTPPPPFLNHVIFTLLLRHLNTHTTSMTPSLHISVTLWSLPDIHRRLFPNGHHRRTQWASLNIIVQNPSPFLPQKPAYLALTRRSQLSLPPTIVES